MSEDKIEALKGKLTKELARKSLDFANISRLATEFAALDSDSAAFSVSATIVRRLGEELVAKQETALGEIVKNAYDADATEVTATFSGHHKKGGRLILKDNGAGMTPEQLREGFLRISSDEKVRNPISPVFGRRRAGQKGIGRFAVERLGQRARITTQTSDDPLATELLIDWSAFENSKDLSSIRSPLKRVPKEKECGTDLIIDGLREAWTIEQIQSAYHYVTELVETPLQTKEEALAHEREMAALKKTEKGIKDGGFGVDFKILKGVLPESVLTPTQDLLRYAVGYIEGHVTVDREWAFRLKSEVLKLDEEHTESTVDRTEFPWILRRLCNVRFKAYYFNPGVKVVGVGTKKALADIRARSGVRLYRNGFRVPPYGNVGNDWLGFDESEAKRELLQPHGNKNWIGLVSVSDPSNELLNETSSREGVVENDFFRELQNFISRALLTIVIRVGRVRGKKVYANDSVFGGARADRLQTKLKSAQKLIKDLQKLRNSAGNTYSAEQLTTSGIAELTSQVESLIDESATLTSEISMLRVLASMGLSITMFSHEVRGVLAAAITNIEKQYTDSSLPEKHIARLKELHKLLLQMQAFTSYYDRAAAAAIDRIIAGIDLYPQIEDFKQRFYEHARQRGVELRVEAPHDLPIRFIRIHEAEFAAVLLNLFTNSMKAIAKVKPRKQGSITIRINYEKSGALIQFLDNGVGIDPKIKATMFEPFVTTSSIVRQSRPGDPDSLGTGLGLTIVRDSISSAGGSIEPVKAPEGFATCFEIKFPFQNND